MRTFETVSTDCDFGSRSGIAKGSLCCRVFTHGAQLDSSADDIEPTPRRVTSRCALAPPTQRVDMGQLLMPDPRLSVRTFGQSCGVSGCSGTTLCGTSPWHAESKTCCSEPCPQELPTQLCSGGPSSGVRCVVVFHFTCPVFSFWDDQVGCNLKTSMATNMHKQQNW